MASAVQGAIAVGTFGVGAPQAIGARAALGASNSLLGAYAGGTVRGELPSTSEAVVAIVGGGVLGVVAPPLARSANYQPKPSPMAQGMAFESAGAAAARREAFLEGMSVRRLSVRGYDELGNVLPGRTVLDVAGLRRDGSLGAIEFKLGPNTNYSPRQQQHFPALAKNGGVVVGENGNSIGFPAGSQFGPLNVTTHRGPTLPGTSDWWN